MEIKDRILQIIDAEQLTASKFADAIGVQRSSISHIVSGRNNPSLEVVQKILISFGTINSEWLLFGRGSMYKSNFDGNLFTPPDPKVKKETKESKEQVKEKLEEPSFKEEKFEEKYNVDDFETKQEEREKSKQEEKFTEKDNNVKSNSNNSTVEVFAEKIIIFNSNRTFIEYKPA